MERVKRYLKIVALPLMVWAVYLAGSADWPWH